MHYRILLFIIIITASVTLTAQDQKKHSLMPVPKSFELSDASFRLDTTFTISITGNPHSRIYQYATSVLRRLTGRTGIFIKQGFVAEDSKDKNASFNIEVKKPAEVKLYEDESYMLKVTGEGITLSAPTDLGALRGMETFLQLLRSDNKGYYIQGAVIEDSPRFPWRGLMIDAGRHFMPVDVIKRNLDGMASVKMNVLHWHLTEDQGFRVESKTFPKLHQLGSDGFYYTQEQIKDIIQYAADRGIRVVPEFDLPGHSTSWLVAFPEIGSAPGPYTIERRWGIFDPVFDPTNPKTYEFFDAFFAEMAQLFTDEFIHIGGDENNGKHWNSNENIQKFMKENNIPDNHSLQAYFNGKLLDILTKYNKKMVGWEEIIHPDMPKNIVAQSWRGAKSLEEAASSGFQVMLSRGYYIDLNFSAANHYAVDPVSDDLDLTEEQKKLIIGGEATQWAEYVTPENIDSRIWPRTAAIAERYWSPKHVKDVDDMYRRLKITSSRLEELGLQHIKNPPMMMRRLAGYNDIAPLKTFIGTVEPVKEYNRHQQRKDYTSYSPYTRVVDAAVPDADDARLFRQKVDKYINSSDAALVSEIISELTIWRDNHTNLEQLSAESPVLDEIISLSKDLSDISAAGIEALNHIQSGTAAPEAWVNSSLDAVKSASQPRGQVELMVVSPIEKLIRLSAGKEIIN